jgi:uncharacterized protein YcgI (DUF1989 family)
MLVSVHESSMQRSKTLATQRAKTATEVIPARSGRAARMKQGQTLKVINTHGTQIVDFWAFSAKNMREFMSMEHTRPIISKLTPVMGDPLLTNKRNVILKIVRDTSPGVHDTTIAACCPVRYRQLGVKGHHASCQENLFAALKTLRRTTAEVPSPFNLFQNSQYHTKRGLEFKPSVCKPGNYISFKAEMDCIVVFSACPQDLLGVNSNPTEAHYQIR